MDIKTKIKVKRTFEVQKNKSQLLTVKQVNNKKVLAITAFTDNHHIQKMLDNRLKEDENLHDVVLCLIVYSDFQNYPVGKLDWFVTKHCEFFEGELDINIKN